MSAFRLIGVSVLEVLTLAIGFAELRLQLAEAQEERRSLWRRLMR